MTVILSNSLCLLIEAGSSGGIRAVRRWNSHWRREPGFGMISKPCFLAY